jgi:hypothetical protein
MVNLDFTVIGVNNVTSDPTIRFKCVTTDGNKLYIGSDTSVNESAHIWEYSNGSFSKITDNLESESFKSVEDLLVDDGVLYAGVGDAFSSTSNYRGQVWANNSIKWVDTGLGSSSVNWATNFVRKLVKFDGKIYAAGSRYELLRLDTSGWYAVITGRGGGRYPGRTDIVNSYINTEHWTDLTTDGSAIYASVLEAETYQASTLVGAFTPSALIKYDGSTMSRFAPPLSYGSGGNRFINKIHYDDGYLYAATHNSTSGTEVWRSPVSGDSWVQINESGFGEHESYAVNDIKSIDDCIVFSVMNSKGCQIWAYEKSSGEWTQQTINSTTPYNAYYIQKVGLENYLVGEAVQYLTQEGREELAYSAPQTYASGVPHLFDNGAYSIPTDEVNGYRFITNNGPFPFVSEGTLEDPFKTMISPYVDRQSDLDRGARGWCAPFDLYETGASSTLVSSFRYTEILGKKPSFFSGELGTDLNGSGFEMGIYDDNGVLLSSVLYSSIDNYGGPSGYENSGIRLYHPQTLWYDEDEDLTLIPVYVEEGNWGSGAPASSNSNPPECGGPRNSIREARHKRASRLLVSEDKGLSFSDCGYLITLPFNNVPNDNLSTSGAIMGPPNTAIIKRSDPNTGEDYLYVYFDRFKNNIDGTANSLSVARAPYSSVITSAKNREVADFSAYYNGSWSQSFSANASAGDIYPSNFRGYGGNYINQPQILKCTNSEVYAAMGGAVGITYDPYLVGVDNQGHLLSLYTEDGVTFSYPQRIINRTIQFREAYGTDTVVTPKYFSQYGPSSHLGETGDSFKSIDNRYSYTSAYGPLTDTFWQTQEIKITSMSSTIVPALVRSFNTARYIQAFDSKYAIDRCQLPGVYATMHKVEEGKKEFRSKIDIAATTSALESYLDDLLISLDSEINGNANPANIAVLENEITRVKALINTDYLSYVTSSTNQNLEGYAFPASVDDYYSFEFGRDLHRLYRIYQDNFQWHRLSTDVQNQDGANIFSHIFGPILRNHDFEELGSVTSLVASSFANPSKISVTSAPFTGTGSFVTSALSSLVYVSATSSYEASVIPERASSGIVDAVELVLTSGTEDDSSFSVLKIPESQKAFYDDPFLFGKTLLLMRSGVGAATRLRFDISKYPADSTHPIATNFLSPDHSFKLKLNGIVSRDSGTTLGGRGIGVWIHTKPEDGKMWSFTPAGDWIHHDQFITREDMISKYSHVTNVQSRPHDPKSSTSNFACIDQVTRTSPVIGLGEEDVTSIEIKFNTRNRGIRLPITYQKDYEQLHRINQNYVIEVFITPGGQPDEFLMVEKLDLQDTTMKKLSEIFAAGTKSDPLCVLDDLRRGCLEYRVDLTKQDIFNVFKYFNDIAGKNAATAYASRDKDKTETIMESEGGSRIDYRYVESLSLNISKLTGNVANDEITYSI